MKKDIRVLGVLIRTWYMERYPDDDFGQELNRQLTFEGLMAMLSNGLGDYVYEAIGVGDSIIRERIFAELATRYDIDYEVVYSMWISGQPQNYEYIVPRVI